MANERIAEIKEYWKSGDFGQGEIELRVRTLVGRRDYEVTHKGKMPEGREWLIERVVRAYLDVPYLLEQLAILQVEIEGMKECDKTNEQIYLALRDRLADKEAEIEQLRDEKKRMAKRMCFYCWFNSVRGGADTHECGDCEWKGVKNGN